MRLSSGSDGGENTSRALVTSRIFLGDHQRLLTELGNGHTFTVKVPAGIDAVVGEPVLLSWNTADCRAFPASDGHGALKQASLNKQWRNS